MLKRFIYPLLLISLLSFITGCAGLGDYSIDLPGDLKVNRISADNVIISSYKNSTSGSLVVPEKVTQVAWDDHYVLAKQVQEGIESYWIVHIGTEESIGPLDERELIGRKNDLGISGNIQLKDIDEYNKEY